MVRKFEKILRQFAEILEVWDAPFRVLLSSADVKTPMVARAFLWRRYAQTPRSGGAGKNLWKNKI